MIPAGCELVQVITTVAREEEAHRLSRELVASGVCACATFFPVRSVYRWKGEVCDESEIEIVAKTTAGLARAAALKIRELHPCETPQVLTLPVLSANEDYTAWVRDSVRREER